jgi:anaerobic ribonucleoside-triphosphate reductase activating protein
MRVNSIDHFEICNGEDVGVTLYTQGCPHHCDGCFNPETWDFTKGHKFDIDDFIEILEAIDKPQIKRFTFCGGDPLGYMTHKDFWDVADLAYRLKAQKPEIKIWLYTGWLWEDIPEDEKKYLRPLDVLVDGPFIKEEKDLSLAFRGSRNQRLIDVKQSLQQGKVILYAREA